MKEIEICLIILSLITVLIGKIVNKMNMIEDGLIILFIILFIKFFCIRRI